MKFHILAGLCMAPVLAALPHAQAADVPLSILHADDHDPVVDSQLSWEHILQSAWSLSPAVAEAASHEANGHAINAISKRWLPAPAALEVEHLRDDGGQRGSRETEVGIVMPLWGSGERRLYRELGAATTEAGSYRLVTARLEVGLQIIEALHHLQSGVVRLRSSQSYSELLAGLVKDVERRVAAGDLATTDLRLAQADWADARLSQSAEEDAVHDALIEWQRLTGQVAIPAQPYPEGEALADSIHPAIEAAHRQVRQAEAEVQIARRVQRSPVEVSLRLRQEESSDWSGVQQSIGAGIRIPVGRNARSSIEYAASQQRLLMAEQSLQDTTRLIQAERKKAWHEWQQHQARQPIAAQRLAAMQERTALLQKAFAAGESALPELLRTLQMHADAQSKHQQARIDAELAHARHLILNGYLP